jgi:hypothetical protein
MCLFPLGLICYKYYGISPSKQNQLYLFSILFQLILNAEACSILLVSIYSLILSSQTYQHLIVTDENSIISKVVSSC